MKTVHEAAEALYKTLESKFPRGSVNTLAWFDDTTNMEGPYIRVMADCQIYTSLIKTLPSTFEGYRVVEELRGVSVPFSS